jgi:hypothetical protein
MSRPLFLELRSSNVFILTVVSFAVFTDIFLYAVIVPFIPFSLGFRAHVPEDKSNRTAGISWRLDSNR